MVDVPNNEVFRVSRFVKQRHPEAVTGGVCWHL
jgi:hypothetical protein